MPDRDPQASADHSRIEELERALAASRLELRRALRQIERVSTERTDAVTRIAGLTSRQRQIMDMVLAGLPNKTIATDLSLSRRTVEHHRAAIMEKTGSKSLPALARLALFAAQA